MMKDTKCAFLIAVMALLLSGCGKESVATTEGNTDKATTEVSFEEKTEAKEEDLTVAEITETSITETSSEEITEAEITEDSIPFSDSIQIELSEDKASTTFAAFDTVVSMTIYGADAENILKEAADITDKIDKVFNTLREDSDVASVNKSESVSNTSDIFNNGANIAKEYKESTNGDFDISIKGGENQFDTIEFGKGYAGKELLTYLLTKKEGELSAGLISMGGNITAIGSKPDGKPWKVGIQDPDKPQGEYLAVIKIEGLISGETMTIATGGIYGENTGGRNVINPHTGEKAESDIISATVVSSDPIDAAVISKALVVKGYDKAVEFWRSGNYDFEMILIDSDRRIIITEGMKDNFSSDITPEILTK